MTKTNESKEKLSKVKIAWRMARKIEEDLTFIATAPLVGQLPDMMKRPLYGESQYTLHWPADIGCAYYPPREYHKSELTSRATSISIGANIIGGAIAGASLDDNPMRGTGIGLVAGLVNSVPSIVGKNRELKREWGSITGYVVGVPIAIGVGIYYLGKLAYEEARDYLVRKRNHAIQDLNVNGEQNGQ